MHVVHVSAEVACDDDDADEDDDKDSQDYVACTHCCSHSRTERISARI